MRKPVCTLPFEYADTPERRVLDLAPDGIACIPALGHSHFKSGKPSVSEHIHPGCMEVTFCLRGSLIFDCDGKENHLLPGTVFVTQPDQRHRLCTNPKGLVTYWLFLRPGENRCALLNLPRAESSALRKALRELPRPLFKGNDRLRLAFQRLFRLRDEQPPGPFRTLSMRATALDLLLALIEAAQIPPEAQQDARLSALIGAMRLAPEREYALDDMARRAGLSNSQLIHRFKRLTGLPPYNFLLKCRVRAAQTLLRTTDKPITEIAQALGFSSSQHFATQFKLEQGITPSDLRRGRQPLVRSGLSDTLAERPL